MLEENIVKMVDTFDKNNHIYIKLSITNIDTTDYSISIGMNSEYVIPDFLDKIEETISNLHKSTLFMLDVEMEEIQNTNDKEK